MNRLFLLIISALLMTAQRAWADYVTDIVVIGHDSERQVGYLYDNYKGAGWIGIDRDLNDGAGGHYIHLVYKTNKSPQNSGTAISNLFLWLGDSPGPASLVHDGRTYYRVGADGDSEFRNKGGDLNCGAGRRAPWAGMAAMSPATSTRVPAAMTSTCTLPEAWPPAMPMYIPVGNCLTSHRSAVSISA